MLNNPPELSLTVSARYGPENRTAEFTTDESRFPLSMILERFKSEHGLPDAPAGYELAIMSDWIGRKIPFGGDSMCIICKPSDVFPGASGSEEEKDMIIVVQPEQVRDGVSFLRAGKKLFADRDLGTLVFAKSDCKWFEDEGAFLPVVA